MWLLIVLLLAVPAVACDVNCEDFNGVCACSAETEKVAPTVVSQEKPSKHPQPAYQRGEIVADMPESLAAQDARMDRERDEAILIGKRAAGL